MIEFLFSHSAMRPLQIKSEIVALAGILRQQQPQSVLEIGTANGGTFFVFCHTAAPDANLISVDLPEGRFGGGYRIWRADIYRRFAIPTQRTSFIRADSRSPDTVAQVKRLLAGKAIEFLFIDVDHSYSGVRHDFEMYSKLVRAGGLIALHDIVRHPPCTGCEVDLFWKEVCLHFRTSEIIENPNQGTKGIGLVWM